jgi:hypothetical protein
MNALADAGILKPKKLLITGGVLSICACALYLLLGVVTLLLSSILLAIFLPAGKAVSTGATNPVVLVPLAACLLAGVGILSSAFMFAGRRWATLANGLVQVLFAAGWAMLMIEKPRALTVVLILWSLAAAGLSFVAFKRVERWLAASRALPYSRPT